MTITSAVVIVGKGNRMAICQKNSLTDGTLGAGGESFKQKQSANGKLPQLCT
jgi:hypothetical protein